MIPASHVFQGSKELLIGCGKAVPKHSLGQATKLRYWADGPRAADQAKGFAPIPCAA